LRNEAIRSQKELAIKHGYEWEDLVKQMEV
jgi:hypothetical protein